MSPGYNQPYHSTPPDNNDRSTIDVMRLSEYEKWKMEKKESYMYTQKIIYGTPLTLEGLSTSCQSSPSSTGPVSASKTRPLRSAHLSLHVSIILIKQKTMISPTRIPMM